MNAWEHINIADSESGRRRTRKITKNIELHVFEITYSDHYAKIYAIAINKNGRPHRTFTFQKYTPRFFGGKE